MLGEMCDAGLCTEEAFARIVAAWDVLLGRAPPADDDDYAGAHELAGGSEALGWEEGSTDPRWDVQWDEGPEAGSKRLEYER